MNLGKVLKFVSGNFGEESMRGLKDGEKDISPMFPRLHVNDTEKGGPRAPPRNKMALYEQLSIPSQRSSPGSASKLARQQNNSSSLVSLVSSGQVSTIIQITIILFMSSIGSCNIILYFFSACLLF